MPNITLRVDEEIIKKVKKIAIDRNTTMTEMIRQFLETAARRDDSAKRLALAELRASFRKLSRDMGPRSWTREDLYDHR
jgi:predicted transcriptional regulator